jgi:hypothetical protein
MTVLMNDAAVLVSEGITRYHIISHFVCVLVPPSVED